MRATLSMLGLLLAAGLASAQTPPADSPPTTSSSTQHLNRLDRIAILLDLSAEQKTQVEQVLQQQRQQMQALWQQQKASGTQPNFQQLRAERQQLRQQTLASLQTILSAEQLNKFEILQTSQHHRGWRHRPGSASSGSSSSSAAE